MEKFSDIWAQKRFWKDFMTLKHCFVELLNGFYEDAKYTFNFILTEYLLED